MSWSCGPRYAVAYAATDYDASLESRSVVFYGGMLDGQVVDGLFIQSLHPELLLSGHDVTPLDAQSGSSPGPRADAVLAYDPTNRRIYLFGGVDADGQHHNDLWVFDRRTGAWSRLASDTDSSAAPPRALAAGLLLSPLDGSPLLIAGTASESSASIWRWVHDRGWRAERRFVGE